MLLNSKFLKCNVIAGWTSVIFVALPPNMFTACLALGAQSEGEILKAEIQVESQTILMCAVLHILPSCISFPMSLVDFFLLTGAGVPARGIPTKGSLLCSKHTRKWRMKHWKLISCLSSSCHPTVTRYTAFLLYTGSFLSLPHEGASEWYHPIQNIISSQLWCSLRA